MKRTKGFESQLTLSKTMVLLQRHRRQSKDERGKKYLEKVNPCTGIFKLQEDVKLQKSVSVFTFFCYASTNCTLAIFVSQDTIVYTLLVFSTNKNHNVCVSYFLLFGE